MLNQFLHTSTTNADPVLWVLKQMLNNIIVSGWMQVYNYVALDLRDWLVTATPDIRAGFHLLKSRRLKVSCCIHTSVLTSYR